MYLYIILPQALRNMVPALLSQFVTTIKDTSYLWGAMALQELMGRGMILMNSYNSTVQIFAIFGLMALIYFVVCFTLSQIRPRLPAPPQGRAVGGKKSLDLNVGLRFMLCGGSLAEETKGEGYAAQIEDADEQRSDTREL